jgi:hypothetical protein
MINIFPVFALTIMYSLSECRRSHFHSTQSGPFSLAVQQGFGTMLIMLRKGLTLQQGTFTAVIAPEPVILSALNDNPDLGRFLFLFLCGNYSRLLSRINRTSSNFEIRRPFTADQLLSALKEVSHTVVFIEHDPTLFDGAERLLVPVAAALRDVGHDAMVILYSPAMDRPFAALARQADRVIEIVPVDEPVYGRQYLGSRSCRQDNPPVQSQKTLEVF